MNRVKNTLILVLILSLLLSGYFTSNAVSVERIGYLNSVSHRLSANGKGNVSESDIISILFHEPYLKAADISVHYQSDRSKMPDNIASALKKTPVVVKTESGGLFSKDYYAVTSTHSKTRYYGEVKDNKPDGFGVLANGEVDLKDLSTIKNIIYAGNFKKGLYNGYGADFDSEPIDYSIDGLIQRDILDQSYKAIAEVYFDTYVTYDGDWKNGEKTGKGNGFSIERVEFNTIQDGYWGGFCYPDVVVTDIKKGLANGNTKHYVCGVLIYDGQTKSGAEHGKGISYYLNGQKKYDGQWKYGMYNGSGKLYDETGKLIYSGKWKKGDYAT